MAIPPPVHDDELTVVKLPSKATFQVYSQEVGYFNLLTDQYQKHNQFTNISDLQDVDRILMMELLCWRYSNWISRQRDYWDEPVDEKDLNTQVQKNSAEIRQLKGTLGLDKVSRDKQRGEDAIATYIERLGIRAKAFGYNRNKMLNKALELSMELIAKVTLYNNCDEQERQEMKHRPEDIMKWLNEVYVPEFQAIDEHFRQHEQKMWVREM